MVTSAQALIRGASRHPARARHFFRMASEPVVEGQPPAPVDFGRVQEAAAATKTIQILGPPPFEMPGS